jgi:hypothetical protein
MAARSRRKASWEQLVGEVARVIAVMPLWKLQTIGREKLDFLYPNLGKGNVIHLNAEAVYCLNRFRDLIVDMTESAWVRFVRRLPRNWPLIGEGAERGRDGLVELDPRWRSVLST